MTDSSSGTLGNYQNQKKRLNPSRKYCTRAEIYHFILGTAQQRGSARFEDESRHRKAYTNELMIRVVKQNLSPVYKQMA